jgi:hypothetical protein
VKHDTSSAIYQPLWNRMSKNIDISNLKLLLYDVIAVKQKKIAIVPRMETGVKQN